MAGTLRPMRVKLAFLNYQVGDVITPNGMERDRLKAQGYIEEVDATPPVPVSKKKGVAANLGRTLFRS